MSKRIKIALIGNPNCGKTTLFNALTGLRQKVGNYPGVTVDRKTGLWHINKNTVAEVLDLPGTYSIYPKRPDERIAIETLLHSDTEFKPDLAVVVCDATSLQRNLLLCTQVIDTGIPTVVALTMTDLVAKDNVVLNRSVLSEQLGVEVIDVSHTTSGGLKQLADVLLSGLTDKTNTKWHYQPDHPFFSDVRAKYQLTNNYAAMLLCSQNHSVLEQAPTDVSIAGWQAEEVVHRYTIIKSVLNKSISIKDVHQSSRNLTRILDQYLLHPLWGYLFFMLVFFFIFQALFNWSEYPMELINTLFAQLTHAVINTLPDHVLTRLLAEGILPGLGGVIAFIPQIAMLFGFIAIMEETGYMSRVSLLTDKVFHRLGMNGKSSVSLIGGLACAVPAIMGTRTIENVKDRLITIMVTPLMSCSARLPVYVLLISFVVPDKELLGFINLQGLVMFCLYLTGFVTALLVAFILKLFIRIKETGSYIAELPIYRKPRWGNVLYTILEKVKVFVWDAGKVIVFIAIVLWFLASYGPGDAISKSELQVIATQTNDSTLESKLQTARLNASYAGHMGKWIEPLITPLGFDWKIGIAIITSFAAREVFVGTMATIYSVGSNENPDFDLLRQKMSEDININTGGKLYTTATGLSLIMFYVFAMQCMSTLAIVRRETKSWKWPWIQFMYLTVLAWVASFITYTMLS